MGKKKKFFNNSYALNKPYRGPFFKKRINHTHLIREKRRTIFPKKISHTYGLFGTEEYRVLLINQTASLFVFSINGLKQNARSEGGLYVVVSCRETSRMSKYFSKSPPLQYVM